mgnify:CR=1 FL=1
MPPHGDGGRGQLEARHQRQLGAWHLMGAGAWHTRDHWNLPEGDASTLNGLLLEELGDIPSGKASIRIGPHIMTVLEIRENMIGKVLVKPERAPDEST